MQSHPHPPQAPHRGNQPAPLGLVVEEVDTQEGVEGGDEGNDHGLASKKARAKPGGVMDLKAARSGPGAARHTR